VLPGFPGHEAPEWILRRVEQGLGGVVLFAWNIAGGDVSVRDMSGSDPGMAVRDMAGSDPDMAGRDTSREQVRRLTASLGDVVVAIDEEGGDVTRLEAATGSSYPGNLALGAVDDVDLTEAVAGALAAELADVGVTLNLAPVADVNTNPDNPVIGVRSFGSDPELVSRHVAAFVRGTQRVGVAACAKHFPGHGDTSVDSHLELPVVRGDLEAALEPFRTALDAGVRAVMTAHLVVPALDDAPATLSRRILTGLLRDELGFTGAIVTDALEMRAISGRFGMGDAAVRALAAGADALCLGHDSTDDDVEAVVRAVVAAVAAGDLNDARVAEAARRVTALAERPHEHAPRETGIGAEAARRALVIEGDTRFDTPPLVVEVTTEPSIAAGPAGYTFADAVHVRWPNADVGRAASAADVAAALARADGRQPLLVVRDAARHEWQRDAVAGALADRPDAVVVETGLPGWRPRARGYVATLGSARVNLDAAVAAIAS
jgi:beta-N-acetylhexosaminidase